jgi:hypothetical protein
MRRPETDDEHAGPGECAGQPGSGGRDRARTCDLVVVSDARYHCATRPSVSSPQLKGAVPRLSRIYATWSKHTRPAHRLSNAETSRGQVAAACRRVSIPDSGLVLPASSPRPRVRPCPLDRPGGGRHRQLPQRGAPHPRRLGAPAGRGGRAHAPHRRAGGRRHSGGAVRRRDPGRSPAPDRGQLRGLPAAGGRGRAGRGFSPRGRRAPRARVRCPWRVAHQGRCRRVQVPGRAG